jgi:hypothetical protein
MRRAAGGPPRAGDPPGRRYGRFAAGLVLLLLTLVVASPARAVGLTLTAEERAELAKLRAEAKALVKLQDELSWRRRTTGESVDIAAARQKHDSLFSLHALLLITRAVAAAPTPEDRKAAEFFRVWLLEEMIAQRLAPIHEELAKFFGRAEFDWQGKKRSYYELASLLQEEADYGARQELADAAAPILRKGNEIYQRLEVRLSRLPKEFGAADQVALAQQLRGVRLADVAPLCRRILDETERDALAAQRWASPWLLDIPAERLRRCDLPRLARAARLDPLFPKGEALPRLKTFLGGLGLSLDGVAVDDAERPAKSPRAACYPIEVPGDVRLTFTPADGLDAYSTLWHEAAHALHFSRARSMQWELQRLGDNAAADAYAFLFEALWADPRFVKRFARTGDAEAADAARAAGCLARLSVRRLCAEALYELELRKPVANPPERYVYWFGRAANLRLDEKDALRCLADADEFFLNVDYLRGLMLAAMLRARLVKDFGEEWFAAPAAGTLLSALWQRGQSLRAEELARVLGFKQLEPGPLLDELRRTAK